MFLSLAAGLNLSCTDALSAKSGVELTASPYAEIGSNIIATGDVQFYSIDEAGTSVPIGSPVELVNGMASISTVAGTGNFSAAYTGDDNFDPNGGDVSVPVGVTQLISYRRFAGI